MHLTENFTLAELVASRKAQEKRIDNTPSPEAIVRLRATALVLERIRAALGHVPIIITSGYRCRELNAVVGGVTSSDHTTGSAADIVAPRYGTPLQIARALAPKVSALGIGQLIYECVGGKAWVHISTRVPTSPANRVITVTDKGVRLGVQGGREP